MKRLGMILALICGLGECVLASDRKTEISMDSIPFRCLNAANKAVPGVVWKSAYQMLDDAWYKLEGEVEDKNKSRLNVEFFLDPLITDSYMYLEISRADVPAAVLTSLKNSMPDFVPTKIQACGKGFDDIIAFRFQGKGFEGPITPGVYVSISGKKVTPVKD